MKTFHILTIVIASIIFSGLFIYIALQMNQKDYTYAPIINNCPDYWTSDSSDNCIIPISKMNIGNLQSKPLYYYSGFSQSEFTQGYSFLPEMNISGTDFNGILSEAQGYTKVDIPSGLDESNPTYINFNDHGWSSNGDPYCEMQTWANSHGIQWDGIKQYKC